MTDKKKVVVDIQGPIKLVDVQDISIQDMILVNEEYSNQNAVVGLEHFIASRFKHLSCAGVLRSVRKTNCRLLDIFRLKYG